MSGQLEIKGLPLPVRNPPGESDEFYTPAELFALWDAEFGFTVDAAAVAESAKCPRFWTHIEDGLAQSWAGERVWCNPPYSDIAPWVRKANEEMQHGCELAALLLPANRTEQPWWQQWVEPYRDRPRGARCVSVTTRFIAKRIRFGFPGDPSGRSGDGAKFASVLVLWQRH